MLGRGHDLLPPTLSPRVLHRLGRGGALSVVAEVPRFLFWRGFLHRDGRLMLVRGHGLLHPHPHPLYPGYFTSWWWYTECCSRGLTILILEVFVGCAKVLRVLF